MRISIIQTDIRWEDKESNLNIIETIIQNLQDTDIVILPEMFNTGFSMNTEYLSEEPDGDTFKWMGKIASLGNFGVCGSYIVKENDQFFNRFLFVKPDQKYWYYDKRHLFSIGGESKAFHRGNERLTFTFRGFRIAPYICYDLRFPVWSRNRNDCDLIIYVANWPEVRRNAWNILLKARAVENQCYVAGSNRVGTDGNDLSYYGDSVIIDPLGSVVAKSADNMQDVISYDISIEELDNVRKKLPFQSDADDFIINL